MCHSRPVSCRVATSNGLDTVPHGTVQVTLVRRALPDRAAQVLLPIGDVLAVLVGEQAVEARQGGPEGELQRSRAASESEARNIAVQLMQTDERWRLME